MMRSFKVAAVAASLLSSSGLVAGAPLILEEITVLGGETFKLNQVLNENFNTAYQGPRALAKAYQKYGVTIPAALMTVLQKILQEMGVDVVQPPSDAEDAGANQGMSTFWVRKTVDF